MQLATPATLKDSGRRANLRNVLYQFVRMYEPHEAREDTVLFPTFRKIVSKHEYDALGEEFEKKENELFHGDGFEKNVDVGCFVLNYCSWDRGCPRNGVQPVGG
jgi:hypothetical protein